MTTTEVAVEAMAMEMEIWPFTYETWPFSIANLSEGTIWDFASSKVTWPWKITIFLHRWLVNHPSSARSAMFHSEPWTVCQRVDFSIQPGLSFIQLLFCQWIHSGHSGHIRIDHHRYIECFSERNHQQWNLVDLLCICSGTIIGGVVCLKLHALNQSLL